VIREPEAEFRSRFPLSSCIELFGYLGDRTLVAYSGDCVVMLEADGVDCECLEDSEVERVVRRQEQARRVLGPEYRLYEYMLRRKDGGFYRTELFAAVLKMARRPKVKLLGGWKRNRSLLLSDLRRNREDVLSAAQSFASQAGCGYRILSDYSSFAVLRRLLNFSSDAWLPTSPVSRQFINCQMGGSDVDRYGRDENPDLPDPHLRVGSEYVRVLTLSELGDATWPMLLSKLQEVPGQFIACSEWNVLAEGRAIINKARNVLNNFAAEGSISLVGKKDDMKTALRDEGDVLNVEKLGSAQRRMEEGERVGQYSLTIVVDARSASELEKTQRKVQAVTAEVDCKLRAETYNQLAAYLATIPGGYAYQFRRLKIMDRNAADLGFWCAPAKGERFNHHLKGPSLLTVSTRQGTRFDVNLHSNGVGHTFTLGATGSGKSVTNNVMLCAMKEKYDAYIAAFDKGESYRWATLASGGVYFRVSPSSVDEACTINPFACEPTKRNLDFLKLLARVLMEQNGEALTADELDKLHHRVEDVFVCPPAERRLSLLADLLGSLGKRLRRWCEGGELASVFDHQEDTLSLSKWQCFEFQGADQAKKSVREVLEPLILTLTHRLTEPLYDETKVSQLKVFLFGEAWCFFSNPAIEAFIEDILRCGRKHNGVCLLESQSPLELEKSRIAPVILDACKTRLYLTSKIDKEYGGMLGLSDRKRELIQDLGQGEILLDQPDTGLSKVFKLSLDERMRWLAANDPVSNAERNRAIERSGEHPSQWLPELIGANGSDKGREIEESFSGSHAGSFKRLLR